MKITDLNYLKNNGKHIDIIKYRNNAIWKRVKKEFGENPGTILTYTASDDSTIPYELLHGSSNYTTTITGEGPYTYTISTDDISDLPTRISFKDCANLLTVDYMCDTSQISDMSSMFENCANLTSIKFKEFYGFDVSNVTTMRAMFSGCTALNEGYIDLYWKNYTTKLTDTSYMFNGCESLTELNFSIRIDTSNVVDMSYMFANCTSLTKLSSGYYFSTESATSISNMFLNCDVLNKIKFNYKTTADTIVDLVRLLVAHYGSDENEYIVDITICEEEVINDVISTLGSTYYRGWTIDSGNSEPVEPDPEEPVEPDPEEPVEPDPEEPVEPTLYTILRYTASDNTTEPYELLHGSSNYTTTTTYLGSGVYSYTISTDDKTDLPTKISFENKTSLLTVDYVRDTSNITNMSSMFSGCSSLTEVCTFNTSNVTNMSYMFTRCSSLTYLNLSAFDISNVATMNNIVSSCTSLTDLDLSGWNLSNVSNVYRMIYNCSSLIHLWVQDCSNNTINKIMTSGVPTGLVNNEERLLYCTSSPALPNGIPSGWRIKLI